MEQSEVEPIDPEVREKYSVIWVNENLDESDKNDRDGWTRLRRIVRNVHVFGDARKCIDILIDDDQTFFFLVISDSFAQELIRAIHPFSNLVVICILSPNSNSDESWTTSWSKIKGVYRTMETVHADLHMTIDQHQKRYAMSDVLPLFDYVMQSPSNQVPPSSVWNKMLVKIVRGMHYDERSKRAFVNYMRENLPANGGTTRVLDEFERDYRSDRAIWWYTHPICIHPPLEKAFEMWQIDLIVLFGFFIRDLCNQIEQFNARRTNRYKASSITVYSGQSVSVDIVETMKKKQGGLICFHSFLSCYKTADTAFMMAESATASNDLYGIFFIIEIDPMLNSTAFAEATPSYSFSSESEILFNPNTCFRIRQVDPSFRNGRLLQVSLTLADEGNQQASRLCDDLEKKLDGLTDIEQLNELLIYMKKPAAMDRTNIALDDRLIWNNKQMCLSHYYSGISQMLQGNYHLALEHLDKSLYPNHSKLGAIYLAIGNTYRLLGNYAKALDFHSKSRDFARSIERQDHPELFEILNSLGLVYYDMGDYSKALSLYRKALACRPERSSTNILDLSSICSNMGLVYGKMKKYWRALSFHQTSLSARERILLPEHPDITWSYHNMGIVHQQMGKYPEALYWYTRALDLRLTGCPADHPDIGAFYHSMGDLYYHMKDYSKALEAQEKALDIRLKRFSDSHPDVASSYHSLGLTQHSLGKIPMAMKSVEKALEIRRQVLPPTHPDLITSRELIKCFRYNSRRYLAAITSWS